jgi:hypothetical protein
MLILGLADGARLDRLRRASPGLSHEQFYLTPELGPGAIANMKSKLEEALRKLELPGPPCFTHILLVEDFSGTGYTLLRNKDGEHEGKLAKAATHVRDLKDKGVVDAAATVSLVLYVASHQAETHLRGELERAAMDWNVDVVQQLPDEIRVRDPEMVALCERHFDEALTDDIKGRPVLGFSDAALPLVLHHNSPNNSICPLWGDTTEDPESDQRRALFPRYERHHADRP